RLVGDPMRNLIGWCPETRQTIDLQLFVDDATLARIGSYAVRFRCPHCGVKLRRRWSGLPQGPFRSNFLKRMGAVMQCLGCRADNKMLLMDVLRDDTMKVPVIEHQIYMCSSCKHIARRLVFKRARTPLTHSPAM